MPELRASRYILTFWTKYPPKKKPIGTANITDEAIIPKILPLKWSGITLQKYTVIGIPIKPNAIPLQKDNIENITVMENISKDFKHTGNVTTAIP